MQGLPGIGIGPEARLHGLLEAHEAMQGHGRQEGLPIGEMAIQGGTGDPQAGGQFFQGDMGMADILDLLHGQVDGRFP